MNFNTTSIEVIESMNGLEELEDDWSRLAKTLPAGAGIGTSFSQILAFGRYFPHDKLKMLVARDQGKVVGIAPLRENTVTWHSIDAKKISFIAPGILHLKFSRRS